MNVLLVEDETHKKDELLSCIRQSLSLEPEIIDNVREAVLAVLGKNYDLIVLDMALPTFGATGSDKNKGHDQALGGIEVLRALKSKDRSTSIVIVTQYPDFVLRGEKVRLKSAKKVLSEKYNQNVIEAILYRYKSVDAFNKISSLLRKLREDLIN